MAGGNRRGARKAAISQREIDALVRSEVGKQLEVLRYRRDPRVARLKKVVALEKMRRLIRTLDDRRDTEDYDF
jgi:hypothetical protein